MSDYNRQFVFDSEETKIVKPRITIKKWLKKKTTVLSFSAALAIGAMVGAGVGAGVGIGVYNYWTRPAPIVVNNTDTVGWVTGAAAKASPSVVTVDVSSSNGAGNGSGVFISSDGYILTNTHVLTLDGSASSVSIEVKTYDGHVYSAKVIGTDPINDLAVIKVSTNAIFTPIVFADSAKLNVGDRVVAIGAPLGLANTVTEGIVSALNRTISVASAAAPENSQSGQGGLQFFNGNGQAVNLRVIQTDAAINPGNSGGALVDEQGRLIGINVAIASAGNSSGQSGNIGVGFAIPANVAARISKEIIKTGKASHALLGAAVSDSVSSSKGFSVGAEVKQITAGGAADKAGVKVGDVVVKFNGDPISTAGELTAAVRQQPAGAEATVELLRNGKTITLNVVLGDAADLAS